MISTYFIFIIKLDREEVLSIFKEIQLLEQEKNSILSKKSVDFEKESTNETKICTQENFAKDDSDEKKEKGEKSNTCFQSGNTQ